MSYSIVFQTKIVKLNDGRIVHFERSGCNNDDEGRQPNVYTAVLHESEDDFVKAVQPYIRDGAPYSECGRFELKIGSRNATMYDYAQHLLRMLARAETEDEFQKNHLFKATLYRGIEMTSPFRKEFYGENALEQMEGFVNAMNPIDPPVCMYRKLTTRYDKIGDCIKQIKNNEPIVFYIGPKRK